MKKINYLIPLLGIGLNTNVSAIDYDTCKSSLSDTFIRIENTGHSPILAKPKGDLLALSRQYEMLCPWQVEDDFNGDKTEDWVGILQKEGKYELVAYLSGPKKHFPQIIKQYTSFPSDTYLTSTSYKWIFKLSSGKIPSTFPANRVLVENELGNYSKAYGWVEKQLKAIHKFDSDYELEKPKPETKKREKNKRILDER